MKKNGFLNSGVIRSTPAKSQFTNIEFMERLKTPGAGANLNHESEQVKRVQASFESWQSADTSGRLVRGKLKEPKGLSTLGLFFDFIMQSRRFTAFYLP